MRSSNSKNDLQFFLKKNHFTEIKKAFSVKAKMFSVNYYFFLAPNTKKYEKYFSKIILRPKKGALKV
jgi:hypothetical protein